MYFLFGRAAGWHREPQMRYSLPNGRVHPTPSATGKHALAATSRPLFCSGHLGFATRHKSCNSYCSTRARNPHSYQFLSKTLIHINLIYRKYYEHHGTMGNIGSLPSRWPSTASGVDTGCSDIKDVERSSEHASRPSPSIPSAIERHSSAASTTSIGSSPLKSSDGTTGLSTTSTPEFI